MLSRANIGGLAAGVRVEQAAPYYQALALEKLGQDDRAKAIFAQLIATGNKVAGQRARDESAGPVGSDSGATRRRLRTLTTWLASANSG